MMVAVAQLVEHRIVAPDVAGSIPVGHPNKNTDLRVIHPNAIQFGLLFCIARRVNPIQDHTIGLSG